MTKIWPLARIDEPTQFVSLSTIRQSWDWEPSRCGLWGAWLPLDEDFSGLDLPSV